ncbi:MAG TPA: inositol monophosphatase family protein [Gemmataceae bacterium]|nr:inositol monophosphatase family protein [Gemmataceae bacterium]
MPPSNNELDEYLAAAAEAARRAAVVLEQWRRRFTVREKGRFDLVTDADVASQKAVREYLQAIFPTHGFLGEEDKSGHGRPAQDAPPTWIVDPIDGTTNYVHDFPFYCVSIGLQVEGELVVGVILEPTRNELFQAAIGRGAWLGSDRLHVSGVERLEDALVSTGFPPNTHEQEHLFTTWRHLSLKTQSLRRTGSTAINLAYIAAGRFDGYWAFDNHVWDVAAGVVLIREAGGLFTNADGSPYDPYTPDCLATNGAIHGLMLEELRICGQ